MDKEQMFVMVMSQITGQDMTVKEPFKSVVKNCYVHPRGGEILFYLDAEGRYLCNLDGYAIIPREEWERVSNLSQPDQKSVVNQ
jgi:hypothetical protein